MKLNKKKGFTIIELVIVIAVIGVLTAILVPVFVNLTARANEASDQSLVKNLNTALKMEEQAPGHEKAQTLQGAINDLNTQGFALETIVAKSGQDLLWDQEKNEFVLNKDGQLQGSRYWQIVDALPAPAQQKFSYYAGRNFTATTVTGLATGFDVGTFARIESIEYNRATVTDEAKGQTVAVRTNGGNFTINAPVDTVRHYGNVNILTVTAVKGASYHEFGVVSNKAILVKGKISVEPDGYIKSVDTKEAVTGSTLVVNGYVNKVEAAAVNPIVASSGTGYVANNGGTDDNPVPYGSAAAVETKIKNVADLQKFRDKVNGGYDFSQLTITLEDDLDVSGIAWAPIGKKARPFVGTFDGRNHTITGLTNAGYSIDENDIFITDHAGNVGVAYGFFGVIGGANDVTIRNLKLANVNFDLEQASALGGLVGANANAADSSKSAAGKITIENITVGGNIRSANLKGVSAAGIIGKVYSLGRVNVTNCTNFANINLGESAKDLKVAGIVGFISNRADSDSTEIAVIDGCHNYGNITARTNIEYYEGGIAMYAAGVVTKGVGVVYVKNCTTQGEVTLSNAQNGKMIYYSPIGRLDRYNSVHTEAAIEPYFPDLGLVDTFEGTDYNVYADYYITTIRVYNNSISTDANYNAFKATITEGNATREITRTYEGLDLFFLYNNFFNPTVYE